MAAGYGHNGASGSNSGGGLISRYCQSETVAAMEICLIVIFIGHAAWQYPLMVEISTYGVA